MIGRISPHARDHVRQHRSTGHGLQLLWD